MKIANYGSKRLYFLVAATACALISNFYSVSQCKPVESWEKLDRKFKQQVFQVNVGLKLKLKDGQFAQLADLSPKYKLPIFTAYPQDRGYRVVSFGTTFPVKTMKKDFTYFLTSRHVVDNPRPLINECERFFAAMRLLAEQTSHGRDVDGRLRELQSIVNWSQTKRMNTADKAIYTQTVDGIWDCYETYLSERVDPSRATFKKYLAQVGVTSELGYFIHPPGPVTQPPLKAHIYRIAQDPNEPDLAILTVKGKEISPMELDMVAPSEGQEIQVIGYPIASDEIDQDANQYYAPTFNTGRISRILPRLLQVDAPLSTGNSGGPVVNLRGKVVGVAARRALSKVGGGGELPNFGGAVTVQSIKAFAPELFGKLL